MKPSWGSVEDLLDIYGSRTAKYGIPVLTVYRRVRAEFLEDQYEPTEDERAAMGNVDTWSTLELPSLSALREAPGEREVLMRLAENVATPASSTASTASSSDEAGSDCDSDSSDASSSAVTVSSEVTEPPTRRAPRSEVKTKRPPRNTVQRTLDGRTVAPPAPKALGKGSKRPQVRTALLLPRRKFDPSAKRHCGAALRPISAT